MKKDVLIKVKKIYNALIKMKKKYVTSEMLSKRIGIFPDQINQVLSMFHPLIGLDFGFNLMDIIDDIESYIEVNETTKDDLEPVFKVTKKDILPYESLGDFVYQKMTIGGIVDKKVRLSETDLHILKKLVTNEIDSRKPKRKRRK